MTQLAASPNAAGPAGAQIEAKIAATYLLALVLGAEGRGLPGVRLDRVKLQRGDEGHPLDDVIVTGTDRLGQAVAMDIQVKRAIAFSPGDAVFQKVLGQVAETLRMPGDAAVPARLAVATSQTSRKIEGPYQDVLTWARRIGEATTFADRLGRPGSANEDMRAFVETFRARLASEGLPAEDVDLWVLLRRFHILVFDFSATDSASEALARDQCARALAPEQATQGPALWSALTALALATAAAGGDLDRAGIVAHLQDLGFALAGDPRHAPARAALAEGAAHALAEIDDRLAGTLLLRPKRLEAVNAALDLGRYVEIRGAGGVGKSSILKHLAAQIAERSGLIVLTPDRTPPGGWLALRERIGFTGTARDLLTDLAAAGGGLLVIDGLDNFQPPALRTVADLARTAADIPGFSVMATLRLEADAAGLMPADAVARLGRAPAVIIGELDEAEVAELLHAAPSVAPLLADTHPARAVARNLYRLKRLLRLDRADAVRTEVDLAELWWDTGDGEAPGSRERRRVLADLADQVLTGAGAYDVSNLPAEAVEALLASGTLRDLGGDKAVFQHDVLRDWAVFNRLRQVPEAFAALPITRLAPASLARGVELLARRGLERSPEPSTWKALLDQVSTAGSNGSWRRNVLLAPARSEAGDEQLAKVEALLLADNGALLDELIRALSAVDVQTLGEISLVLDEPLDPSLENVSVPRGPAWARLIVWVLELDGRLPAGAMPAVVSLFATWLMATRGHDWASKAILSRIDAWLTDMDARPDWSPAPPSALIGPIDRDQLASATEMLRRCFAGFGRSQPALAKAYLTRLRAGDLSRDLIQHVIAFPGSLAFGAAEELADLTAAALINSGAEDDDDDDMPSNRPFTLIDSQLLPESPAQGPFLSILEAAPRTGLSLLRRLINYAMAYYQRDPEEDPILLLPGEAGERQIVWPETYGVARPGRGLGHALTSGLMALEHWGHNRIEQGDRVGDVIAAIMGEATTPAAMAQVAIDILLSHWTDENLETALPFLASPELLALDQERFARDGLKLPDLAGMFGLRPAEPGRDPVTAAALAARPSRRAPLDRLLGLYAFGPPALRERLAALLSAAADRLGPATAEMTFADPPFMALHAQGAIDPANWTKIRIEGGGPGRLLLVL
jgi:energy-coupling factor transporter ATP-binding protein EcfA2